MTFGLRLSTAAAAALLPLPILALRLADLQVLRHGALESRAAGEFERVALEAAPRADIVDREGRVLARSLPSWSCFVDRAMVKNTSLFAQHLAPVLGESPSEIERKILAAGRFAWLKTGLSPEEMEKVKNVRIEGIGIVPVQRRAYPNGDLARSVLGTVGAEGKGLSGLELTFDRRLRGQPRRFELIRDGAGKSIYKSIADDGSVPPSLKLTIDRSIQYVVEEALAEAATTSHFKSGYAAVQDPRDGSILALAAWPSNPLNNPLVQDAFEPGSTFKIVTALSAIEDRLVRDDETFFGENGRWEVVPGVAITDHEKFGDMTLAQILEKSSNIGIAKVVERVGAARFYRTCRALGFGVKTAIPMPGETAGDMKSVHELNRVGLASASYGYGQQVSPLQLLGAYSAIANGGSLWEPRLIEDGRPPNEIRRVGPGESVRKLAGILESVVERGTGQPAAIPGYRVAGKTGTARQVDSTTHRYSLTAYTASFVGFLPASSPRWTILVILNEPKGAYYGGLTAAPVFGRIGRRLLTLAGIPADRPAVIAASAAR